MQITDDIIASVKGSLRGWMRAAKGKPPNGFSWDDIEQECYIAVLEDDAFDPSIGELGKRINSLVKRTFIDVCRASGALPLTNWLDGLPDDSEELNHPSGGPSTLDDGPIHVDAKDLLDSLDPEDRAVVDSLRDEGLAPRDTALRRRQTRVRKKITERL